MGLPTNLNLAPPHIPFLFPTPFQWCHLKLQIGGQLTKHYFFLTILESFLSFILHFQSLRKFWQFCLKKKVVYMHTRLFSPPSSLSLSTSTFVSRYPFIFLQRSELPITASKLFLSLLLIKKKKKDPLRLLPFGYPIQSSSPRVSVISQSLPLIHGAHVSSSLSVSHNANNVHPFLRLQYLSKWAELLSSLTSSPQQLPDQHGHRHSLYLPNTKNFSNSDIEIVSF